MDNAMLDQVAGLLDQASVRILEFKKETYAESFRCYLGDNASVWNLLASAWDESVPDREQVRQQIAEHLTGRAQDMLDGVKGRTKKEALRLDLNLYMVSYVLPAIVAYQRRCGGGEEGMKKLTDAICDSWETRFGQHIQTADHESIQAGFKQKLCFVTTAVCCGLHKPQDCRELTLMKRYRDEYLSVQAEGESLIREYYDIAPTIVKRIAKGVSPEEKYLYLWDNYISKCAGFIEHNENERCRQLYEAMMTELKEEYMVTDRHKQEGVLHRNEQTVS